MGTITCINYINKYLVTRKYIRIDYTPTLMVFISIYESKMK